MTNEEKAYDFKVKNKDNNMKDKELNLVEILKDCPKGTKLYSTICGECELDTVDAKCDFPIAVIYKNANNYEDVETFTKDGRYRYVGECVLFPSKDSRDWSMFKASRPKHEFKPFDKVLGRDSDDEEWHADFFSHMKKYSGRVAFKCIGFAYWQCIPYEGNEHLLGTCDSPDEKGGEG